MAKKWKPNVFVSRAKDAGVDDSGGPWVAICDTHGTILNTSSQRLAKWHAQDPTGWCEECREEAAKMSVGTKRDIIATMLRAGRPDLANTIAEMDSVHPSKPALPPFGMGLQFLGPKRPENAGPVKSDIDVSVPTGDCFRWAVQKAKDAIMDDRQVVFHGLVAPAGTGKKFWHAWVEMDGKVFDWQNSAVGDYPEGVPRDKFYKAMKPAKIQRYTAEDAMLLAIRNRHYGPWEKSKGDQVAIEHKRRK